jgi:uncharacterized protein YecE (DUF72 family)
MPTASQGSLFHPPQRSSSVRVGPAGWNYKDWEGVVYPSVRGRSFDPLAYLADYFDTIEINSSFYAPPRPADAASWARRVRNNQRFRFTAKAWQRLTHDVKEETEASLTADSEVIRRALAPLAEAGVLGAVLIQFPWSFRHTPENLKRLERLFHLLSDFPIALEVRHGSWNSDHFYEFLRNSHVAFCNIDQPVIGNSMKPSAHVTAKIGYFRMHGRNYGSWFAEDAGRNARYDYLYSREEVQYIARQIRTIGQSAQETYAITNNHFRGQALVNAIEILEELEAQVPAVPPILASAYPDHFQI